MTHDITTTLRTQEQMYRQMGNERQGDVMRSAREEIERLRLIVGNIKIHFDRLCTHELRDHGVVSPEHTIDFQVFRVLCGYKEVLEDRDALRKAARPVVGNGVCDQSGQHVTVFCSIDEWAALAALVGEG